MTLRFLSFSGWPDLHYNRVSWTLLSPPDAMPLSRRNLNFDEQSFQGLLSAAFTIQEHNDQRKRARQAPAESEGQRVGRHGDAPRAGEASRSESGGLDELRPGERLQRNWASMWMMSQERGLWPERSAEIAERPIAKEENGAVDAQMDEQMDEQDKRGLGESVFDDPLLIKPVLNQPVTDEPGARSRRTTEAIIKALAPEDLTREDTDPAGESFALSASDEFSPDSSSDFSADLASIDASTDGRSWMRRLADGRRVKLRFRRADLYLGTSIFVAALALLWPAAGSPRRASLSPWERALVTIGIAEAPAPAIHLQGDPGIEVWVDPHSAHYYCPGEEQYGKTSDGRLSSQHDAKMDRFEPAGRSACE
jgi:hypothetical protein